MGEAKSLTVSTRTECDPSPLLRAFPGPCDASAEAGPEREVGGVVNYYPLESKNRFFRKKVTFPFHRGSTKRPSDENGFFRTENLLRISGVAVNYPS